MKILKFKNKQKYKYSKKILIEDLILSISIGIHNFEKLKRQRVKFNIEITTDPNLKTDIKSIVNYENVIITIKKLLKKNIMNCLRNYQSQFSMKFLKIKKLKRLNSK